MDYGRIFISVRQRVAAFRYWNEFLGRTDSYGHVDESDYLDDAYRFLNMSARKGFIEFCAEKENRTFDEYCSAMNIVKYGLLDDRCAE